VSRIAIALLLVCWVAASSAQQPARHVNEQEAHEIGSQLRCVVCQNLSVADSPSEMAGQMRGLVRERLAAGDSREQVMQYFVDRYGDWILLSPRREGFTLIVWLAPIVATVVGLLIAVFVIRRWTSRKPGGSTAPEAVEPHKRERIRREMEREEA
jgi:cytochrome c-type biogenesis protein CcmH